MILNSRQKYRSMQDAELVLQFRSNTRKQGALLGEIYTRYGHLVMGTAMKYLKNRMDAEDLTMKLFEGLTKKLTKHDVQHLKSWLYMVTRNECLMVLRKKGLPTTELDDRSQTDNSSFDEEKELQLSELEKAINDLKDEQKKCIELFYLESKSYQEVADLLNMDLKKVKSAIQNGKRNLKIRLTTNETGS